MANWRIFPTDTYLIIKDMIYLFIYLLATSLCIIIKYQVMQVFVMLLYSH